ncbi:NEL-type E3 ubiquitin ligase domain-containing protein [Pseudomonas poae]|uniref:NEL-type E3 ubiquitin ligase domain-containing protein n=1 Tax=Pseudomonas poae TaxID=200451 RepID=UPI0016464A34|nr:NEL-type E3 ubiquitin ligase domain-containing protein [Pseudomonas poae]MBC3195130.1 hypothetical protein [Pseudomonas poae]
MPTDLPATPFQGRHVELIQNALPDWIKGTTPARIQALQRDGLGTPVPYPRATPAQHQALKTAVAEHWQAQTALDKRLGPLNDLRAFAESLLKGALLPHYGDVDMRNTSLRVYMNAPVAWWAINLKGGVHSKTLSLLDMALHNFAAGDRFVDHAFMGPEDARGQRQILSIRHQSTGQKLTVDHFKAICRTLDIGGRYQAELRTVLGFDQPAVAGVVRAEVVSQLKADLRSSAHLGLHSEHLPADAHQALLGFIDNPVNLTLDGQRLGCYSLSVAGSPLAGVMLFTTDPEQRQAQGRVIAWVPQDPEHPLKQYASPKAFVETLTRQLRDGPDYPVFFSQFVAHAERGAFFAQVKAGSNLKFSLLDITQDTAHRADDPKKDTPWHYLYRVKLNKIVNDARELAVSTAYVDRLARRAWWDNLEKILSDVLNAVLLVVTPFVPVLGQMMMVYSVYQLCDEVFEGLLDWAQGRGTQAAEHLLGVAENLAQFAVFAGAGKVGAVLRPKLSAFVEGMHPIEAQDGARKLWNPDLQPYAHPADRQAEDLRPLQDRHYKIRHDPATDEHRLVHPTRPDAYQPRVVLATDGAFVHEGEQPQRWDSQTLMRRLGPRVQGLSDPQLQALRIASGTDEGTLRSLYRYNEPLPPLLAASLDRLQAQVFPDAVSRKVRAGEPLPNGPSTDWFPQLLTELPGWPRDKALSVYLDSDPDGAALTFGHANAAEADTLTLSQSEALSGKLPEHALAFLDDSATRTLLGDDVAPEHQVQTLRDQLADQVMRNAPEISDKVYQTRELTDDPSLATLREPFDYLDSNAARTLLASATQAEREALAQRQLPLRLRNQARELAFANESALAYQGFDRPPPLPSASERLALNALKVYSDTFGKLRLEIREHSASGEVSCAVGPLSADTTRVLIRNARGYLFVDPANPHAASRTTLYQAILQALPAEQRNALGFQLGEGGALKQWIKQRVESLAERRVVLAEPPVPVIQTRETSQLLGGPVLSRCPGTTALTRLEYARQTLQLLFPSMTEERLTLFLEEIPEFDLVDTLQALEAEKQLLHVELQSWKNTVTIGGESENPYQDNRYAKKLIAQLLERCWADRFAEYTDGWGHVQHGTVLRFDLLTRDLLSLPPRLPTLSASFEHVTVLEATGCEFGDAHSDFLKHLPSLRGLNLANNRLTQLPKALQGMRFMRDLKLSGNRLVLNSDELAQLKTLKHLKNLDLSNNPLQQAPDVSWMPGLRTLRLAGTQVDSWPAGLFAQPRTDEFLLDLRGTRINHLPDVAQGSAHARLVARTRLDRATLTDEARQRYETYRTDAGLDPNRTYEPRGANAFWLEGLEAAKRSESDALWKALEREQGSQGFFEVIDALQIKRPFANEADQGRYTANRPLLNQQVWRMLLAAYEDSALRERLFKMASFPGLCPDAGAQIFNEMGIEVLVSEAYRDAPNGAELEARLVTLAKGSARLKQLAKVVGQDIALRLKPKSEGGLGQRFRSDVRDGEPGEIDEVDVHLAYQTSLAAQLDLPWLSDHMLYRATANVSSKRIEKAFTAVTALGEGDGLVNQMLLEPWWEQHLRTAYESQCSDNEHEFGERFLALDDLQTEQAQWASADTLEAAERNRLRERLKTLADAAQVPESVVFADAPMSDDVYNRLLNDLGYNQQEWMRRLTRTALTVAANRTNRTR